MNMQLLLKRSASLFLLLAILFTQSLYATRDEARRAANRAAISLSIYGFDYRSNYEIGRLDRGQSVTMARTLYRGNEYALTVGGDASARDIDIYVYDRNWNIVAYDEEYGDVAIGNFNAYYTGTYFIRVKMYSASRNNAYWCMVYGYR